MEATFVHIRIPGCEALEFDHFLRAVFCLIEDGDPPVDEKRLDAQSVLAGFFQAERRSVEALLCGHSASLRFLSTVIPEPLEARTRVYRHLVANDPGLVERRPRVFGSLESFLFSDRDSLSAGLCRALGTRNVRDSDFDFLAPDGADATGAFARCALDYLAPLPASRSVNRTRRLLECTAERPAAMQGNPSSDAGLARKFRKQNRHDYALYDGAIKRLEKPRSIARRASPGRDPAVPSEEPVFVFNHLPKCYGSSVRVLLARAFSVIEDHTEFLGIPDVVIDAPCETARLRSDTVLCGHFCDGAYRLPTRYPEIWEAASRFRIFTFLREPLTMAVSNYHHVVEREADRAAAEPEMFGSLEKFLTGIHNPLAYRLGCDESNWEETLARYFFVGTAEQFSDQYPVLLERMAAALDDVPESTSLDRARKAIAVLASEKLPHENPRRKRGLDDISTSVIEQFNQHNALDLKIYNTIAAA